MGTEHHPVPDLPWPEGAAFQYGQRVQRSNMKSGHPPAYRFRGRVVGWYASGGGHGYVVSLAHDPGCNQIFPEHMLELWHED